MRKIGWTATLVFSLMLPTLLHAQRNDAKVQSFAHAIAKAEGFYIRGTIPNRYHNPGDLTCPRHHHCYDGQRGVSRRGYVIFRSNAAGWAALKQQLTIIIDGTSKRYSVQMTLAQMGRIYAGDRRWARKIAGWLSIDTSTTLAEYFEVPPSPFNIPRGGFTNEWQNNYVDAVAEYRPSQREP